MSGTSHPHELPLTLDQRVVLAINSKDEFEKLIEEFKPFIYGCVTRFSHGNTYRADDLKNIAMLAFYEAVNSYSSEKGHFLPFASVVIRSRLADDYRKEYKKTAQAVPFGDEGEDVGMDIALKKASLDLYERRSREENIRLEIEQLKSELSGWGITLDQLVRQSPKHEALRRELRRVINLIVEDNDIMEIIMLKRYLPLKKITALTKYPEKKVEHARKYILASVIILNGDYDCIGGYINT